MLKPDLIAAIAASSGLSRRGAAEVLTAVTDEIVDALAMGDAVRLHGLGTFAVRISAPRNVRDPRSGSLLLRGPRRRIVFRPGASLRRAVDAGAATDQTDPGPNEA